LLPFQTSLQSQLESNQLGFTISDIGTAFNVFKTLIIFHVFVFVDRDSYESPDQRIIFFTSILLRLGLSFQTKDANHVTKGAAIDVHCFDS
jgi:hypothetical protein